MRKVKDHIMRALYSTNANGEYLSKMQILLMVYLLTHCSTSGQIAVYHKDAEKAIGMTPNTFYSALNALAINDVTLRLANGKLVNTPLIKIEDKDEDNKSEIVISIPYNNVDKLYEGENRHNTNYTQVDVEGLKMSELKALTLSELRVVLYVFFRICKSGYQTKAEFKTNPERNLWYGRKGSYKERINTYKNIARQLGVSIQTVRKAIRLLKGRKIINLASNVELKNGEKKDVLTLCKGFLKPICVVTTQDGKRCENKTTQTFRSDRHRVRNILRRMHQNAPEQDVNDIAILIHQYEKKAKKTGYKSSDSLITKAISRLKSVSARAVNAVIKILLDEDNNSRKIILT